MLACIQIEKLLEPLFGRRVYPDSADENQSAIKPYAIYREISNQPQNEMDGITGHEWVHMQIDVYHTSKLESTYLANQAIQTLSENIIPSVYGGKQYMKEDDLHRHSIDFEFWQTADTKPNT